MAKVKMLGDIGSAITQSLQPKLFRDLKIGDTFDFIGPDRMLNSFYARCRKVSARCYRDDKRQRYTVGTINCEVFHVNEVEAD